ncbi:MAG: UDP-glucose/GDP-mannose dehydrogenase family protein [Candidatus Woesearchaeota archaeon]|nr:UDP-glucose/GDP-mannose dehydrogenase family protein [Candidatus Woesearchaeota archaeon]
MDISIIGAGYVGLIQGAGLAKLGSKVILVDVDQNKVDKINRKDPPIYEKGLKELLREVVPKSLTASTDLKKAINNTKITFICVGTPSKKEGSIILNQLETVSMEIGKILKNKKDKHLIVIKSTVVPETCEKTVIPLLEKYSGKKFGKDFGVAMNPEFLKEGSALDDFFAPDRIVIGSADKKSIKTLKQLYRNFKCPILETSFREAEMIKYASNAFLATKISFINEIGNVCKKIGIDTNIVAKGIGFDKRINPYFLRSGIGFGGSCFPKDVVALIYKATEHGYHPRLLSAVLDVNKEQPLKLLEIIEKHNVKNKKIAILGLTFKAGTDDIRESPAISIIKELLIEEPKLYLYDPMAMENVRRIFPHLNYTKTAQEAVDEADIVLILTEWPEFKDLSYGNKPVIDGKNVFDGKKPKNYEGICW